MEKYIEIRGRYNIACYRIDIDSDMRQTALKFAKDIILSGNQYSRLLPEQVRNSNDVSMQKKIEIQRTYIGKLGELVFVKFLEESGKAVNTDGMLEVYEGQDNVDPYDFMTLRGHSVDVKTGFRNIHTRLLVNVEQFYNIPKDYYAAVKIEAADTDSGQKLVDWESINQASILGYAERNYMEGHAQVRDFGEGDAKWLFYNKLLGIDSLLNRNFLNLGIIESRNYIRISYGSFLYAGTNGISPFS